MGLEPEARPLSRFCRSILQPFARTAFVLRKSRALARRLTPTDRRLSNLTGARQRFNGRAAVESRFSSGAG